MMNPVLFFIFSGQFMFLYHTVSVIIYGSTAYNPCLRFSFSYKFINIIAGCFILYQNSFLFHFHKIFSGFFVDPFIIKINPRLQIHLRSVYMKKRKRVLISDLLCFFPVHHIIWKRSHICCFFLYRAQCLKRAKYCHIVFLLS